MLGSHKLITAGYFLVAGVGGFFAYQQSTFTPATTLKANPSHAASPLQTAAPVAAPHTLPLTSELPAPLRINQTLLAAHSALQRSERIDSEFIEIDLDESDSPNSTAQANAARPWQVDRAQQRTPGFQLQDDVREYEVVATEAQPTYPDEGEQVLMPLLNGQQVVVNVKSTRVSRNGDYGWSGHLDGYGEDYPVVMTYGKNAAFAMITTPQGSYSMEAIDGVGWLYKNPAEHELTAPGHEDFLEIPEQHHTHRHPEEHTVMDG